MEPQVIDALTKEFPSSGEYTRALTTILPELNDGQRRCLWEHCRAPGRTITARQLAAAVGYAEYRAVNLQYGGLASRLCKELNVTINGDALFVLAFFAHDPDFEGGEGLLVMRPQMARALELLGWSANGYPPASSANSLAP
jgi:hypothetical protein